MWTRIIYVTVPDKRELKENIHEGWKKESVETEVKPAVSYWAET